MTSATLPGFLNKKEIEASYGRSYRSLTRDITRAVKSGDVKVLQHLKLVTDDEKVREGTEVDLDLIQELSNNGLRPMWLAEETWVAEWCSDKSSPQTKQSTPIQEQPLREPGTPNKTFEGASTLETVLQQRLHDLKTHNELLVDQLKIKDDQIRAANQQAEQSQQLMRDLHVLLKNVQDGLLGEGNRPLISSAKKPSGTPPQPAVVEEKTNEVKPRAGRIIKTSSKTTPRKRSPSKPETSQPKDDRLHRWFPTFLGSKRKRTK